MWFGQNKWNISHMFFKFSRILFLFNKKSVIRMGIFVSYLKICRRIGGFYVAKVWLAMRQRSRSNDFLQHTNHRYTSANLQIRYVYSCLWCWIIIVNVNIFFFCTILLQPNKELKNILVHVLTFRISTMRGRRVQMSQPEMYSAVQSLWFVRRLWRQKRWNSVLWVVIT